MPPAAKPMRPRRRTLRSLPKRRIDINTEALDFKNVELLKKFLTEKGRILPRRITGMTAKMHRKLTHRNQARPQRPARQITGVIPCPDFVKSPAPIPTRGNSILRSGKAKKKGGIGTHVTANTPRVFQPNLKEKRIFVPELKRYVTVKLTARALKTLTKNGAYTTLKKAGVI